MNPERKPQMGDDGKATFVALVLIFCILAAPAESLASWQNPKSSSRPPTTNKESAALRQQARAALRGGKMDDVERILETSRKIRLRGEREAWQVFEAEFHWVRKDFKTAALKAMRLVILSPKSAHAGEALYWAARAYDGLKRPEKAAELYRECIANKTSDENTVRQARAALLAAAKPSGAIGKPLTTRKAP